MGSIANRIMSAIIFGEVPDKKLKCVTYIPVKQLENSEDSPDWEDEDMSGATEQEFGR